MICTAPVGYALPAALGKRTWEDENYEDDCIYWGDAAGEPSVPRMIRNYTHVRLYYFCRPASFNSHKEHGIPVYSYDEIAERLHRLFLKYWRTWQQSSCSRAHEELEASDASELDMTLDLLAEGAFEHFIGPEHLIDFTASFYKTVPPEWLFEYRRLDDA